VKSGGNAFGRGALLWPGSAAADLGPILGVAFGQPEVGALIPKWPLQAEATQGSGEVTTGAPPIATMRAVGHPDQAVGDSRVADVHIPRVVHIEHIASTSSSVVTDSSVSSIGRVSLRGVTLLGGHIKAEEIRSVSQTTSLGSSASSSGDVDIIGLKIGGIDVSVTDEGFHVSGLPPDAQSFPGAGKEPAPGTSPEDTVNQILGALGARITLFNSISRVSGGQAERMQPGVVISVENPAAGQGAIPPGQRFDFILAATSSSAFASSPFAFAEPDIGGPDIGGVGDGDTGSDGPDSFSIGDGPKVSGDTLTNVEDELSDGATGNLGAPSTLGDAAPQRSDYRFDGLPLGLVIALLLLAAVASRYVRRFMGSMIGGAAASTDGEET
jgi:hypothetical protein